MNVLVTGGAGYIGSHTCKELASVGHTPITYDNLSRGNEWAVRWGPFVRGNIGDRELLQQTFRRYEIEAVVHLAGYAYVGESMLEPGKYFENNSVNSLRLLQETSKAGITNVVFSSTCATYGDPKFLPIDESHPQAPINPYGESKLFVENVLRWFEAAYGTRWAVLRYFNAAGADQDGEIGECHTPETHLIPLVLRAATSPHRPVQLFGSDFPTQDGTPVRDYIHVCDLAQAHVKALTYLAAGNASKAFNLGTGSGCSVAQIVKAVETVTGLRPATVHCSRRAGDPAELVASTELAAAELKWTAQTNEIHQIIESAWRWHQGMYMERRTPASCSI